MVVKKLTSKFLILALSQAQAFLAGYDGAFRMLEIIGVFRGVKEEPNKI